MYQPIFDHDGLATTIDSANYSTDSNHNSNQMAGGKSPPLNQGQFTTYQYKQPEANNQQHQQPQQQLSPLAPSPNGGSQLVQPISQQQQQQQQQPIVNHSPQQYGQQEQPQQAQQPQQQQSYSMQAFNKQQKSQQASPQAQYQQQQQQHQLVDELQPPLQVHHPHPVHPHFTGYDINCKPLSIYLDAQTLLPPHNYNYYSPSSFFSPVLTFHRLNRSLE